jgi:type II restriction enzyme
MLYFLAIMSSRGERGAKAFLGLTYNPFVTRANYSHSFTRRIMDMENEVLIGSELWDYLGGPGTYRELLEIIDQVNLE